MTTAPRHTVAARVSRRKPSEADKTAQKQVGRPKGEPSTIINVRVPLALLARLDRYLDRLEGQTGLQANRGMIARHALQLFLETHEPSRPQERGAPPMPDRNTFHHAYQTVGKGRAFVRIHRLRASLGWGRERFDTMLRTLAAEGVVELHGGDPSQMTEAEVAESYWDTSGQVYLTVSWRG